VREFARRFSRNRPAVAGLTILLAVIVLALLSIPVAVFIALAVLQEKFLGSIRYRTRAISFSINRPNGRAPKRVS